MICLARKGFGWRLFNFFLLHDMKWMDLTLQGSLTFQFQKISHTRLVKLQSKAFSAGLRVPKPICFLLAVRRAGSAYCKLPSKTPEDAKEDTCHLAALAAAKETGCCSSVFIRSGGKNKEPNWRLPLMLKILWLLTGFGKSLTIAVHQ